MFDWSSLNDKQIAERVMNQAKEMDNLAATVAQKIPGISDAQQYWYDTEVLFKNQYQERLNELKNTIRTNQGKNTRPGEKVWSGKPIREGVEAATRWSSEESGAKGNVLSGDTVGSDQVSKSKKLAVGGSVTPGQPRQESFINPSLRLANGQVTLNPLEFMPNYDVGGVVKSLATPNNISRLTDIPYINDAVQAAQKGNYGDLIGSAVNTLLPTGAALATYSPELNSNEASDLSKTQYVQGHFGRQPRTWTNGMAVGGKVHVSDDLNMMRHELNTRG